MGLLAKIFGTKNEREIKSYWPRVHAISSFEPQLVPLSDDALASRIAQIRAQIERAREDVTSKTQELSRMQVMSLLDPYLNEVFALVREAGKRVLNMRHFDVQIMGGMVLHSGKIAEMKTGEGKTLVATLPAVLNALVGRGVHVVTVNDYLASRDAEWMGRIYRFLGLSVGVVLPHTNDAIKKEAYNCDITYGQNNEFGFDYLRDNMKFTLSEYVQRGHHYAIVDEVDSILIDEARTPLIISGASEESSEKYKVANSIVPILRKELDYSLDEKSRAVMFTESGVHKAEKALQLENLYDPVNLEILHHLNQALRAHVLYRRDVEYVLESGQVVIVDEHTGRLMHGRRWSDGLHQAIEAKENVRVQPENQTLATITFQNYFRLYSKLSGMTGTADTEAEEFAKIYDLDVVIMPPNRPMIRVDENDQVFKTEDAKWDAIVADIERSHQKGQPVLVGTVSVEKSEILSKKLGRLSISHHVLNAKKHRDEAAIIAQAGRYTAVTIATNMAGRGTDIVLGGDPEFMARSNVAKKLHEAEAQIAEFQFLTGRAELINTEKLAFRDQNDLRFLSASSNADEDASETKPTPLPTPPSQQMKKKVFEQRKAFYAQAVSLYREELVHCTQICQEERQKVLQEGGLRIIGTERHESRRIDNQLRGRAGRQGDPGSSCFYLSLQDDLMRIFGSDRMIGIMEKLGMEDGVPIEHPWISKSIANAQKRVEGFHFDSRKQLIEYDDVMSQQRKFIYGLRKKVLGGENAKTLIFDLVEQAIINLVQIAAPPKTPLSEWKLDSLTQEIYALFSVRVALEDFKGDRDDLLDGIFSLIERFYSERERQIGGELLRQVERLVYLQTIDQYWREHLQAMDHLREGIHFRGYAQKDPKQEYKHEGFLIFTGMMARMRSEILEKVFKVEVQAAHNEVLFQELARMHQAQAKEAERLRHSRFSHEEQPLAMENPMLGESPAKGGRSKKAPVGAHEDPAAGINRKHRRLMKAQDRKTPPRSS